MFEAINEFIRQLYGYEGAVNLHEPVFLGKERDLLAKCIDSGFVSSVGAYVDQFESEIAAYTGARFAISTSNGTSALHAALVVAGVKPGEEVVTQALSFVATANAIAYCGARPTFIDVDRTNLGLSPTALQEFFESNCERRAGCLVNKSTGRKISACVPVHVFGHPLDIKSILAICEQFEVPVIEDAAEGLGSKEGNQHLGTFGLAGILSFNGNKVLTTGGGGMLLTNDERFAKLAKHLTTTARLPGIEYSHDQLGYNYRMPNLNAALGCAQLENLEVVIANKTETAFYYSQFFEKIGLEFIKPSSQARSNHWLNAIVFNDRNQRDEFLTYSVQRKVYVRPAWRALNQLPMYQDCFTDQLLNTRDICDRLVNLPSSYRNIKSKAD